MQRIAILIAVAALLNACGGGSDEAGSQASASNDSMASAAAVRPQISNSPHRVAAPEGSVINRLDSRLRGARGQVDVWVSLEQNSVAGQRAALAEASAVAATDSATSIKSLGALRQGVADHRQRIADSQAALANHIASLGGREITRVQVAHNAIAVRIDAARLTELATMPGVAKVRPVINYELDLSDVVRHTGAAAVQASGVDGTGVTVAVLDSGIDYTHRNLGGPGTVEAYVAAYGTSPSDPRNTTRDGLFPTAKVTAGFDFVGESWPNTPEAPDPDPIDYTGNGHGTHVADIIAGNSLDGTHKGMAPGAKLVAVKVCSAVSNSCSGVALLQGMDFALDPNGDGDTSDAVDVINMSLGQGYGQLEDDLSFAAANAVKLGVVVVVSAGNDANKPYVVGSPSTAPGVISVAQTQVPSATAIPLVVNSPPAIAGVYANTATVDWAPIGNGVSGDVVFVGRGCPADSVPGSPAADPYLADPAGKIVLIDRGGCSVSLKVDRAAKAKAVGVLIGLVAPGDAVSFSYGGGDTFVPTLVIQQVLSNSIKAQLAAGQTVNVSILPSAGIPLIGSIVSSSSRGPSGSAQAIKPEIGAPGGSVSAEAGTGTGESAFSGTSGAAPVVAGAAALLVQAYPNRRPEKIKAMLMNSAETEIYTNPALLPGQLAPITRIGAGEVRVDRAIKLTAIAWNRASKSASLAFGALEVSSRRTEELTLRIENFSNVDRVFTIDPSFRYANDEESGAVRVVVRSTVRVAARSHEDVEVKLVIDPSKLPTWTLNGGSLGGDGAALNGPEYDGYITLTSNGETLSVPWHVLPRKAAEVDATLHERRRHGLEVRLRNRGAEFGEYDVFSLIGVDRRVSRGELPGPGDSSAVIDLRAVGVRFLPAAQFGANYLEFAVNTFGRRASPAYPAEFDIYLDTTGDGEPDFIVFNAESGGFALSGQSLVYLYNIKDGTATAYFYADADFNSANMIMTVPMAPMGLAPGTTIGIRVEALDNYFTGNVTDEIANMRFTPGSERFGVVGEPFGTVPPKGSAELGVRVATLPNRLTSELGLLIMYRRNDGQEADILRIR